MSKLSVILRLVEPKNLYRDLLARMPRQRCFAPLSMTAEVAELNEVLVG
jgi:hypothetical protein